MSSKDKNYSHLRYILKRYNLKPIQEDAIQCDEFYFFFPSLLLLCGLIYSILVYIGHNEQSMVLFLYISFLIDDLGDQVSLSLLNWTGAAFIFLGSCIFV
jgi:hypothetical protein